ncbi:hypothetical protein SLE2022_179180 [Rubroshorea leprosula]
MVSHLPENRSICVYSKEKKNEETIGDLLLQAKPPIFLGSQLREHVSENPVLFNDSRDATVVENGAKVGNVSFTNSDDEDYNASEDSLFEESDDDLDFKEKIL